MHAATKPRKEVIWHSPKQRDEAWRERVNCEERVFENYFGPDYYDRNKKGSPNSRKPAITSQGPIISNTIMDMRRSSVLDDLKE